MRTQSDPDLLEYPPFSGFTADDPELPDTPEADALPRRVQRPGRWFKHWPSHQIAHPVYYREPMNPKAFNPIWLLHRRTAPADEH